MAAPDLQTLFFAEPEPSFGGMWEMAEHALDAVLANLPVRMGEDTRLACSIIMRNGTNCHQSAIAGSGDPLSERFHALPLQESLDATCGRFCILSLNTSTFGAALAVLIFVIFT